MIEINYAQEIKLEYNAKIKRKDLVKVIDSESSYKYLKPLYEKDINLFESSVILLLNRANYIIGWYKLSSGGIVGTIIDTKIICKIAIDCLASAVILSHNHPSSNKAASSTDFNSTKKVKEALKVFDILLVDHIIMVEDDYLSMADEGTL